jgi:hypothetical protein
MPVADLPWYNNLVVKKLLLSLCLSLLTFAVVAVSIAQPVPAQEVERAPISPEKLEKDIQTFFNAGAQGYLLWQFCGTEGGPRGHRTLCDDFGFFSNSPEWPTVCSVLKEAAGNHPDKFVGVNMWDLGEMESADIIKKNLTDLNTQCGVTVVRIFALNDASKVAKALDGARGTKVKLIIALGDWVNGGVGISPAAPGLEWFGGGYRGEYEDYAIKVSQLAGQNRDLVYGLELANEPHCKGDGSQAALDTYKNWADDMALKVKNASGISNIGIGQMASQNTTRCDSPEQSDFKYTNSGPNITMVSGHNYSDKEIEVNLAALNQTPAGKFFYVGEAGGGGSTTEEDPYYIYPIDGLTDEALQAASSNLEEAAKPIWQDMINQGYNVMCAAPKIAIQDNTGPADLFEFLKAQYGEDFGQPVGSELFADYTMARIPLYRDPSRQGDENKFRADLESFFGYQDLSAKDGSTQLLYSGPAYALLSQEQQCQYKINLLKAMEAMCQKLPADRQASCALYHETIPDSQANYTTKALYDDLQSSGLSCADLIKKEPPTGFDTARFARLRQGVNHTPLYLNKAYRLAFIVLSATYYNPDPNFIKAAFNFLRSGTTKTPINDVRVLAVKVPDFAMNRYVIETTDNSANIYQDPLQITRDALLPKEMIEANREAAKVQRQTLLNAEEAEVSINGENRRVIECNDGEAPCNKPLVKALVTMINKSGETCEVNSAEPKFETSEKIGDAAHLKSTPTEATLKTQDVGSTTTTPSSFSFMSEIHPNWSDPNENKSAPRIYTYFIIPQGEGADELEFAQDTLAGIVYTKEGLNNLNNDPNIVRYFKLNGVDQTFQSQNPTVNVTTDNCHIEILDGVEVEKCDNQVSFSAKADPEKDQEPRILGAKLGLILRDMQKAVRATKLPPYRFIKRCKTTEELLLGQCGAETNQATRCALQCQGKTGAELSTCMQQCSNPGTGPAICEISGGLIKDPSNPARWIGGEMIKSQALKNLIAEAAKKYNTPVQVLMTTLWMENCRGAASICDLTDEEVIRYSQPGAEFPGNCVDGGGQDSQAKYLLSEVRAKGPFQFYHSLCNDYNGSASCEPFEPLVHWGFYREVPGDNICNLRDATYAAARKLSIDVSQSKGLGYTVYKPASEWTLDEAKLAVTLWSYFSKECDANEFTRDYCWIVERMWEGDGKVTTTCN